MDIDLQADRIGFALIKIAAYVRRHDLRRRIESSAFNLIETVARRNIQEFFESIPALEALIRVGKAIYEIEPINADMLISEIANLKVEVRQIAELSLPAKYERPEPRHQNLWHSSENKGFKKIEEDIRKFKIIKEELDQVVDMREKDDVNAAKSPEKYEKRQLGVPSIQKPVQLNEDAANPATDNQAMRQSAIADKIRKFDKQAAQLKDIIAEFPNVSERTLRYDLQRLCSQGVIERIGPGGPGTYYRVRVI